MTKASFLFYIETQTSIGTFVVLLRSWIVATTKVLVFVSVKFFAYLVFPTYTSLSVDPGTKIETNLVSYIARIMSPIYGLKTTKGIVLSVVRWNISCEYWTDPNTETKCFGVSGHILRL